MLYRGFLFSFVVVFIQNLANMKESFKSKLKRAAMYLLGFSATPMLTACYGVPTEYEPTDYIPFDDISGQVVDRKTDTPIKGIEVSVRGTDIKTTTDSNGSFYIDQYFTSSVEIQAKDIDGAENGDYYQSSEEVRSTNNHNIKISLLQAERK